MKQMTRFVFIMLSLLLSFGLAYAGGPGAYGGGGKASGSSYPYGAGTTGSYGSSGTSGTYGGGYVGSPSGHSGSSAVQRPSSGAGMGRDGSFGPQSPACENFLSKTVNLRREFELKRFEYWELKRDPKAKPEDLARGQGEIQALWKKIELENSEHCRWQN